MEHQNSTKPNKPTAEPAPEPVIKHLYRLPKLGKVSGVCAGLAEYLALDVTLVRLLFVILTLASGGFGLLAYIALLILMPVSDTAVFSNSHSGDLGQNFESLATELRDNTNTSAVRNYLGISLVLFGGWLLLLQFFPRIFSFDWSLVWPAILVVLGVIIMLRRA